VGSGDGVHVAGQVEVEQLHRDDLAVAAAGGAALDPEGRTHGGLADGDGGLLADVAEALAEADGRGGLALAERRGGDGRDDDVARLRAVAHGLDGVELDLGGAVAIGLEVFARDAGGVGDFG